MILNSASDLCTQFCMDMYYYMSRY